MKRLALAAAGAALIGLTACTNSASPGKADATQGTGTAVGPVSCSKQFRTWTNSEGERLMGALHGVSSATEAGNGKSLTAALKHAKPAVARGARHPIPACADPRGYWDVLLMHVNAATSGKSSPSSVRAALRDVPKIHHQLLAEIKQTAG